MRFRIHVIATAGLAIVLVGSLASTAYARSAGASPGGRSAIRGLGHPGMAPSPRWPGTPASAAGRTLVSGGQVLYSFNTGLVLTVAQNARAGAVVRVEKAASLSGQSWTLTSSGHLSPASNPKLCLNTWTSRRGKHGLDVHACDGLGSERFVTRAPSAHTPVFFISPRAYKGLCVRARTTVQFFGFNLQTPVVGLSRCDNEQGQAWATINLANVVGRFAPNFADGLIVPGTGQQGGLASIKPITNSISEEWTITTSSAGWTFSPIENTGSCLTVPGTGSQLTLSPCGSTAVHDILPIVLRVTKGVVTYVLAVDAGQHCVTWGEPLHGQPVQVVVGACPNTTNSRAAGIWYADSTAPFNSPVVPSVTGEFSAFYDEPDQYSTLYAMTAQGTASGSAVVLTADTEGFLQTWTDVRPGTLATANPDDSISIRPLNDLSICLTVPGANYQAGVQLQVQTCDGAEDQEFSATMPDVNGNSGPAVFSPFTDSSLCVAPLAGITADSQVGLESCPAQQTFSQDDTWGSSWVGWANWVNPTP